MLEYFLVDENDAVLTYRYHPEGEKDYGFVYVNKTTGDYDVTKLADADTLHRWYVGHMFSRIRRFLKEGKFEKEGIVAWY